MAADIQFVTSGKSGSAASTHNIGTQSIGTASADRVVLFAVFGNNGSVAGVTVSSATIGGNAATLLASTKGGGGGESYPVGIFALAVPSGTTAAFSVTFSDNVTLGWSIYTLTGTGGSTTAFATATDDTPALSQSLNIPADGAALGIAGGFHGAGTGTASWTNLPTEDVDTTLQNANNAYSSAHGDFASAQASAISVAWSGGSLDFGAMAMVSFESAETIEEGAGSSDGTATVTGVGASTYAASASASGSATVIGVGASIHAAVGEADSQALVQGVGTAVFNAVGLSAGAASVAANGTGVFNAVGLSAGQATVQGFIDSLILTSTLALQKPVDVVLMGQQHYREAGREYDIRPTNIRESSGGVKRSGIRRLSDSRPSYTVKSGSLSGSHK